MMGEILLYYIYKHTFPNGKVYIGMTENPLKRFGIDGTGYKYNVPMNADIEKYGWDNIKTEILKGGLSLEEAQQQEKEFILAYNSEDIAFGYNQTNYKKSILEIKGKEIDRSKKLDKKPIFPWGKNINFTKFIKSEIDYIRNNGNLSEMQSAVFELRVKGLSLEECAKEIGMSVSTIKRTNGELRKKIKKLMDD